MSVLETEWLKRWHANGCGPFSTLQREDGPRPGRCGPKIWDTQPWAEHPA